MPILKHLDLDDTSAAEPLRRRGVLRREDARLLSRPFEVEADWTPDLPLPAAPDPAPADPDALREAWKADAEQHIEEAVATAGAEAFEAGREEGLAAARAEHAAELEAARAAFADAAERLCAEWAEHLARAEPLLVQLALDTAEALLHAPLPDALREVAADALTEAVERLAADAPLTVTVHPVTHLRLQEHGIVEHLGATHPALRWATDAALSEGDWTVETPKAAVRRVQAELLAHLRDRLGLHPDADAES